MVHSPLKLDTPQEWDLSDLYTDFDDPRLVEDLDSLQQTANQFRQQYQGKVKQLTPEQIVTCLQDLEQIYQKSGYLYAYPSLVFAADTRNTEAKQFLDKVMEALTGVDNQLLFFDLELKSLDSEAFSQLQASPALKNYQHHLIRIAELRPYKLSEEVEQTRNRDSLTGRQAFIQLRSVHLGEQEYPDVTTPEGKTANTEAELSALLYHPQGEVRHNAYSAVRTVIKEHNLLYGYILNAIAQDHKIENQMRGYPSTLQKQLIEDQVSEPVFTAIMEGTASRFDLFQRYYQLKSQEIGQKIRICDLYAPWTTQATPPLSYQSGVELLLAALEKFDINYARRAEEFFLKSWIDAKVRPGKRGGRILCLQSWQA